MAGWPFYVRWRYRKNLRGPIAYPRYYYVLGIALGEALLAIVLLGEIAWAAIFDFHRGQPPFPDSIGTTMMLVGAAFGTIAIACLIPIAVISLRGDKAHRSD
jgi:hypothetical protein